MSTTEFWQKGEALDYTNSTSDAIEAGDIVQIGSRIGIAGGDIAPGKTGAIHTGGVWKMPKTGTAAISMGQAVYFDGTGITDDADDGGSPATAYAKAGYAAAAALAADEKILVKIDG